jgi:hypothetical protein
MVPLVKDLEEVDEPDSMTSSDDELFSNGSNKKNYQGKTSMLSRDFPGVFEDMNGFHP